MPTQKVLDVARYRSEHPDRLAALHPVMVAAVRRAFPGLLHADLARLPDGSFLDIVAWDSEESAAAGMAGERQVAEYQDFAALVGEVLLSACVTADSA